MMMLASSLRAAAANVFSPSKNACMVAVTPTVTGARRYRNDPYRAHVLASVATPEKVRTPTEAAVAFTQETSKMAAPAPQPLHPRVLNTAAPAPVLRQLQEAHIAAPQPAASAETLYCMVRFKHSSNCYKCQFNARVGDTVVVEGDRGINMGTVSSITSTKPSFPVPSSVLRLASQQERELGSTMRHKEAQATRRISELSETHAPQMKIVDTEYQVDGNKLTVFFSAKNKVDFRQLQRAMFREFKCRVWLVNWNEVRA